MKLDLQHKLELVCPAQPDSACGVNSFMFSPNRQQFRSADRHNQFNIAVFTSAGEYLIENYCFNSYGIAPVCKI